MAPPHTDTAKLDQLYRQKFATDWGSGGIASLVEEVTAFLEVPSERRLIERLPDLIASARGDTELDAAIERLTSVALRRGDLAQSIRRSQQLIVDRYAEFVGRVNENRDGRKTVVFVAKSPYFLLLREAIYLRKNGFRTFLLTLFPIRKELRPLFERHMDGIAHVYSHFAMRSLMERMHPDIFHVQCWMLSYEIGRLAIEAAQTRSIGVVCEFYDISSVYADRDRLWPVWGTETIDLDHALEHYILNHADAVASRYPDRVMENWGRRFGRLPPCLNMQAYPLPEFIRGEAPKFSAQDGAIHLVYAGGLVPTWLDPALFPEASMPYTLRRLLNQGLAIDIVHDPYRPINSDGVYAPFRELERRYPKFRLLDGVGPDELPAVLARYDFGILLCNFPSQLDISADQKAGVVATKIYAYLEAGIPILVNAEYLEMARIAEEYGVGVAVHTQHIDRMAETIAAFDRKGAQRRIEQFNDTYRMDRQIHRLIDLYERAGAGAAERVRARDVGLSSRIEAEGGGAPELREAMREFFEALGQVHGGAGGEDALLCYRQAVGLSPDAAAGYVRIGEILERGGRIDEAVANYQRALVHDQAQVSALGRALSCQLLYGLADGRTMVDQARHFREQSAPGTLRRRRRRVGIVAAVLSPGAARFMLAPFLSAFDRERLDVFCYVGRLGDDVASANPAALADRWIEMPNIDPDRLASQLKRDDIDLAVEIAAGDGAASMFTRRVAPVQARWTSSTGSAGIEAVDYLITDRFLMPFGAEPASAEKIIRVAGVAWNFPAPASCVAAGARPDGLGANVTLGLLGNGALPTPEAVSVVAAILRAAPSARLVLSDKLPADPERRGEVVETFARTGISEERILFQYSNGRAAADELDILLAGLPERAAWSMCEPLWAGVPVVVLDDASAEAALDRAVLVSLGLEGLAVRSAEDCVRLAVDLASDVRRREQLKRELRWRMADSMACDRRSFARNLSAAFATAMHHG